METAKVTYDLLNHVHHLMVGQDFADIQGVDADGIFRGAEDAAADAVDFGKNVADQFMNGDADSGKAPSQMGDDAMEGILDIMIDEYELPLQVIGVIGGYGMFVWMNLFNIECLSGCTSQWGYVGFNLGNYA